MIANTNAAVLKVFTVEADRITGEWIGEPEFVGTESRAEWMGRADTDAAHFDTYEHDGETRAIEVVWVD